MKPNCGEGIISTKPRLKSDLDIVYCFIVLCVCLVHWPRYVASGPHTDIPAVYRCLHGIGPEYFSEDFTLVSKIQSRQRLHSASSTDVMVPATRRSSLGDRAFPVAGAQAWNALPASVTAAPSLSSFRRLLKTFLFQRQLRQ